jgi:tRNA threonylcarbamoyl adenosine modification protein (Sua5/YciO/YrdC/YwlC family)
MLINIKDTKEFYSRIIEDLKKGRIIALPTDTIYGFAVDGVNTKALERLTKIKEREDKPFTFFTSRNRIEDYAHITKRNIIECFVPGPITVILRRNKGKPLPVEKDKIGIRIPQVDFIIKLLSKYDNPLAVTSANRSGELTLHSALDIVEQFPGVDLVIDGGRLISEPSTVIDLATTPPVVKRKGVVPILEIERVYGHNIMLEHSLKFNVLFVCSGNTCRSPMAEGLLKTMVDEDYCVVKSAGTLPMNGLPPSANSVQVVKEYEGSIRDHLSQTVSKELIGWADLILVMGYKHFQHIIDIQPAAVIKTSLLKEYKRKVKYNEISDPVGQDIDAYRDSAESMLPSLKLIARDIKRRFEKRVKSKE